MTSLWMVLILCCAMPGWWCVALRVDDPLFSIDVKEDGLVLVQHPVDHSWGVVCVAGAPKKRLVAGMLCPLTQDPVLKYGCHDDIVVRATISAVECDPAVHSYLSFCNVSLRKPHQEDGACRCDDVLSVTCAAPQSRIASGDSMRRLASAQSFGGDAAVVGIAVYEHKRTTTQAVAAHIAEALSVSLTRVNVSALSSFDDYAYASIAFTAIGAGEEETVVIDQRQFGALDVGASDDGVITTTTTTIPATTTTAAPTTTTTTAAPTTTTTTAAPTTTTTTAAPTTTTTTAAPTTTTTTAAPTTTTTTAAPTTTTTTAAPTTTTTTAAPAHTTTTAPTQLLTSTAAQPTTTTEPAFWTTTTPLTASPNATNDDLPPAALAELLPLLPLQLLTAWGILELRTGDGLLCHNVASGNFSLVLLAKPPSSTPGASTAVEVMGKLGIRFSGSSGDPHNGAMGTACGDWTDADALAACIGFSAHMTTDTRAGAPLLRGFSFGYSDDALGSELPILAQRVRHATGGAVVRLSNCSEKRNDCTHARDAGVACFGAMHREHLAYVHFMAHMSNGSQASLENGIVALIPSSAGRVNVSNVTVAPGGAPAGGSSVVVAFAFTPRCNDTLPTRYELERMLLGVNAYGLYSIGVLSLGAVQRSLEASDCPVSISTSPSKSMSVSVVRVFVKVRARALISNITHAFETALSIPQGSVTAVRVSGDVLALYFSSVALAVSGLQIATSGEISDVLAASFLESEVTTAESNDPDGDGDGVPVIVVGVVAAILGLGVIAGCVVCVARRQCCASVRPSPSSLDDASMNTLFLPVDVNELEDWQPDQSML